MDFKLTGVDVSTVEERVAVLEDQRVVAKEDRDEIKTDVAAIRTSLDDIKKTMMKQKSFLGGVAFAATSLGFFIKAAWEYLQKSIQ